MFLLNNIHDRPCRDLYPDIGHVVFDISDQQLHNGKNQDWHKLGGGSIACVVTSTRRISTFYLIAERLATEVVDPVAGRRHVVTGKVVAKLDQAADMAWLLKRHGAGHPLLRGGKFSNGFNVADLGDALDSLLLATRGGPATLGEIKAGA